ncbi:MAG: outer membrane protein domain-containing [Rhodospirillaceae bacterium]|nr:MAG: outer membrane protein domain-containing [Rhodospirillaceae bacterium]TNC97837.1 MAG: outer membrane protein domain-containing protein [Stygiobacter sp.]
MGLRNVFLGLLALLCVSAKSLSSASAADAYAQNPTVTREVAQEATKQTTSMISGRISSVVSGATGSISPSVPTSPVNTSALIGDGKAAGDAPARGGLWANASHNWMSGKQASADFAGTMKVAVGGVDYRITDQLLLGTSLGYEHGYFSLKYSGGKMVANNYAFAPYMAYIINDIWSLDATAGHAWVNYDISRANGNVAGSTSGSRWFAASNLSASTTLGPWRLGASTGYLYSKEDTEDYVETDGTAARGVKFRLGQAHATVRGGYLFLTDWGSVNPFVAARAEYDANKTAATAVDAIGTKGYDDRFGMVFTSGVNLAIGDSHSLSIEAASSQFRENVDSFTLGGTYRFKF